MGSSYNPFFFGPVEDLHLTAKALTISQNKETHTVSKEMKQAIAMLEADLALPIDLIVSLTEQGIDVEELHNGILSTLEEGTMN